MDEKDFSEDTLRKEEEADLANKVEHFKGYLLQDLNRTYGENLTHLDQFNFLIHHVAQVMATVNNLNQALQSIIKHQFDESIGPLDDGPIEVSFDMDVERIPGTATEHVSFAEWLSSRIPYK